ncbi:MAG TPA: PAS domain-containing protein, partial [Rubrivivax sp.]|nr:PAS domain-containing protein [Rubrivivax sp.]
MPTHLTAQLCASEISATAADSPSELALAIELGHVAVWRLDIAQQRVYPNLHAWEVLGLPATDAGLSMTELRALLHPDDLEPVVASTEVTLASVRPTVLEARYRRPDGSWRHVLMHRAVQRDSRGTPLVLIAVGIDITERIQQREQAEEMVRRFELVTRTAGIGYWMLEEGAERAVWSDELRTIFGLPEGDPVPVLDEWLARYVHPADREDLRRSFASRA